ncbi:chaperone protein dnaJ 20, chloroplastic [Prosopis cineraria]|uniref:chaperone protein dnaJ 20, chloroplastic n=1 Tax=Prosopis cineraria TaxID=364024 RepID=UPI00240F987A|nr:chaperone protein dnaJ 20, chloroplastic [Prosopis cineraria]
MRCYAVAIPGSDYRFFASTPLSVPANNTFNPKSLNFPSQIGGFVPLRVKAAVNDGYVAEASKLSFYELLGIPESGSLLEIKQAYKQLARKYHPDVSPPDRVEEYTRRFIQVQEAYETLSDPRRRALYDRDMSRGIHLAFSARRHYYDDEVIEPKSEWKARWQSQLSELKRRSNLKDKGENLSWAARMRRQREESCNES